VVDVTHDGCRDVPVRIEDVNLVAAHDAANTTMLTPSTDNGVVLTALDVSGQDTTIDVDDFKR
jgi:hypothetical protein